MLCFSVYSQDSIAVDSVDVTVQIADALDSLVVPIAELNYLILKNLGSIFPSELKSEFKKLHARLIVFENHPYEKRAFLYLDVISWLESKIENKPVATIIQEKAKKLIR